MRLLNVHTIQFEVFNDNQLPHYAIASHRWYGRKDETTHQDFRDQSDTSSLGHQKVLLFAAFVRENINNVDWLWIDTCCIGKRHSQEVQESMISMFKYYERSAVCLAYLIDVRAASMTGSLDDSADIRESVWFTRGWTLQELLAPSLVVFLSQEWQVLGHKGGDRYDTRSNLLYTGLFGASMPIMYNEGASKARQRFLDAINYKSNGPHDPQRKRTVWVPHTKVSTYTERLAPLKSLELALSKASVGSRLAHSAIVSGLGGTGKTQLVLRFIELHERDYDTVLWIDARTPATARWSFQKCYRRLNLPQPARAISDSSLSIRDIPEVYSVLDELHQRSLRNEWLVVIDNADDLSWDISQIIPQGRAGTVILISQDHYAFRILDGAYVVRIDAMELEEAISLYLCTIGTPEHDPELIGLAEQVVESLDRLPLAIDLAGARTRADSETQVDVITAVNQYLEDFESNQKQLMKSEDFSRTSQYNRTVWTVWDTSLQSLRKIQQQGEVYPVDLLTFLTYFERNSIHQILFRLASRDMSLDGPIWKIHCPPWLRNLLRVAPDGSWDSFCYRSTVKQLVRFGFVRDLETLTTHSLVHWRVHEATDEEEFRRSFIVFLVAVCGKWRFPTHSSASRKLEMDEFFAVYPHIPEVTAFIWKNSGFPPTLVEILWAIIGNFLLSEDRFMAAETYFEALLSQLAHPGHHHAITRLECISKLMELQLQIESIDKAEAFEDPILQALESRHHGTDFWLIQAMRCLAQVYWIKNKPDEARKMAMRAMRCSDELFGTNHRPGKYREPLASVAQTRDGTSDAEELALKIKIGSEGAYQPRSAETRQRLLFLSRL